MHAITATATAMTHQDTEMGRGIPRPDAERATRFERATICLEGDPPRVSVCSTAYHRISL